MGEFYNRERYTKALSRRMQVEVGYDGQFGKRREALESVGLMLKIICLLSLLKRGRRRIGMQWPRLQQGIWGANARLG